jgi:integrase
MANANKLTDARIRNLPLPTGKARAKIADGNGLILMHSGITGSKIWYQRSLVGGKEQMIRIGPYPAIGLAEARRLSEGIRIRIARGLPPKEQPQQIVTFGEIAQEWLALHRTKTTPEYCKDIEQRLQKHVLPFLGNRDIRSIKAMDILNILERVAADGTIDTARRLRQYVSAIFRKAVNTDRADADPAAALVDELPPVRHKHLPAKVETAEVQKLFKLCTEYWGHATVMHALIFGALTAARPGMVTHAEWCEIDISDEDNAVWSIPAEKMKMRRAFRVPLSRPAVEILKRQSAITGSCNLIFQGRERDRPLSATTMRAALRSMGVFDHVPHGWRSSFSSIANASGLWRPEVIEAALAHIDSNAVRAAYNRADYFEERRDLMRWWALLLMDGNSGPQKK